VRLNSRDGDSDAGDNSRILSDQKMFAKNVVVRKAHARLSQFGFT
jgi:hypothetical protein